MTTSTISTSSVKKLKLTTRELVQVSMFTALLTILSQISLPMPTGVPITIQAFAVVLTGSFLGWRLGCMATIVYILLGIVGLPVFSNFQGGLGVLTGVTGGYIWAWPLTAALSGIHIKFENKHVALTVQLLLALIGLAITELMGGLQWAALAGDQSVSAVLIYSFTAFIPKDIVLTILAVIIAQQIRRPFVKAGYIK